METLRAAAWTELPDSLILMEWVQWIYQDILLIWIKCWVYISNRPKSPVCLEIHSAQYHSLMAVYPSWRSNDPRFHRWKGISVPVIVYWLHLHFEGTSKCMYEPRHGKVLQRRALKEELPGYTKWSALSVITSQFCDTKQYVSSVHGCCVKVCANESVNKPTAGAVGSSFSLLTVLINKGFYFLNSWCLLKTNTQKNKFTETGSMDTSHLRFSPALHTPTVVVPSGSHRDSFFEDILGGRPTEMKLTTQPTRRDVRPQPTLTQAEKGWLGGRDGRGGEGGVKEQTETKSVYNIQCVMSALRNSPTSPRVVIITTWQQLNEQISYSPLYLSLALWSPPLCSLT